MRRMRTWIGPSFRGERLIGNRVVGKKGGKKVCQRPEDVVPDGTMELRVHGVNGGTPEQNLHDPSPVLITGDDTAGFYRRRKELQSGPKRVVEVYNWASINSKKSVRAWWLALFPFAAVNLAGWLLPKGLGGIRRGAAQVLVRLIALCVTVLGVLGLALVFVDLIGVQCAVIETCTRDFTWGWVGSIASWGPIGNIPVRLAVAYSLPPALLLLALWLIGRRGRQYENYGVGTTESKAAVGERIDDIRMNQVEFWQAPDVVYVQAWLHGAVAMGALAAVMAHSVRELVPHGQYHDLLYWLGIVGFGIVFAGTAAVGFVSGMKQIPRRWLRKQDAPFYKPRASWLPAGLSIALFGIVLWLGWFSKTSSPLDDQPPLDAIRNGLIIAAGLAVLLVVLLGCVVGASRSIIFVLFLGWAIVKVVARTGNAPGSALEWNRLGGGGWLTVEALLAIAGVAWYAWWSRSTQAGHDPKDRQRNPVYIYGSTGVIVVCGIASYLRTDALWMLITALAIPVIYLAAQFVLQIRNGHDYPAKEQMREGTSAVVAGLGVTSVMTLISSGTVFVAQRLGTAYALPQFGFQLNGNQCPPNSICYPAEIGWFSLAAIAGVVVLVVSALLRLGLLYVARWRSKAGDLCLEYDLVRPEADRVAPDGPPRPADSYDDAGDCNTRHDPRRLGFARKSVNARWLANVTDDVDWLIGAGVMTTLTLVTAAAIARSRHFLPNEGETAIFGFASWAVAGVVVGGGLLVYSAKDSKQLRQTLGILWDVMAFFPRRFHPLAPPCYAERSVIDVRDRIIHATTGGKGSKRATGGMILVAHSEGTLISAAALLSLLQQPKSQNQIQAHPGHPLATGEELAHVRFVTYGCMLARLYSRAWPDQLPESSLMQLKAKLEDQPYDADLGYPCPKSETLPRWMNFGRYSDYLGGRVFQELQRKPTRLEPQPEGDVRSDDVFFIDPTRRWRFVGQLEHARIWRHSFDYESDMEDPRFREHIWATARALNGEDETLLFEEYGLTFKCVPGHVSDPSAGKTAHTNAKQAPPGVPSEDPA